MFLVTQFRLFVSCHKTCIYRGSKYYGDDQIKAGKAAGMEQKRNAYIFLVENLKKRNHLGAQMSMEGYY
jgi:hypothetical protein